MKMTAEYYPTTVQLPIDLSDIKKEDIQNNTIISGGTLLQLNWEAGIERPERLISTEKIVELKGIESISINGVTYIKIGASTTIASCLKDPIIQTFHPILGSACQKIAAPAVRNRGTIGGNVCSKTGDLLPVLLILEAVLQFFDGERFYKLPVHKWIEEQTPHSKALLTDILIPNQDNNNTFFVKIGRRETFTAATVSIAGLIVQAEGLIQTIRFAYGGGSHHPSRLSKIEMELEAKNILEISEKRLYERITSEMKSYTDPFITAEYRKKMAANLFVHEWRKWKNRKQ